jgi:hypothetical protein
MNMQWVDEPTGAAGIFFKLYIYALDRLIYTILAM